MPKFKWIKRYFSGDGEGELHLNRFMKKKQNIVGGGVLAVLIILTCVLHSLSEKKVKQVAVVQPAQTAPMDGVLSTDFTQKNELSALEQQQAQMDRLRQQVKKLSQQLLTQKGSVTDHQAALVRKINAIIEKREAQQKEEQGAPAQHAHQKTTAQGIPFSNAEVSSTGHDVRDLTQENPSHPMETIAFHYDTPQAERSVASRSNRRGLHAAKTPKTYVPAGTFARGVLLEGADANASVNGQSDTVAILVRLLDSGTLPNGHHSHLSGCFVLASMYGDISSERGEARLTTLSCTRSNGTILEKKVQGYLSFSGKEGIKGTPVMRNGKILAMAGMSGLLSGVGSALQQSTQTQSLSPLGATASVSPNKVWQNGASGGASTAMGQLAHYYIQRADQYHPIIEVGSGTVATVIFQHGFSLVDDNQQHTQSSSTADASVTSSSDNTEEMKTLLKTAQRLSNTKTAAPFSNVN